MAEKVVLTCDRCHAEGAERFGIEYRDSVWRLDLCERHSKAILDLLKHGRETVLGAGLPDSGPYEKVTFDQLQQIARRAEE